ncbi:MAG: hypothetical protein Ta2D_12310 [Rickettsiales bacterium]|nr:MAG: hypothetical protein Ta2D_12310 [Rickettsiales bacterium]
MTEIVGNKDWNPGAVNKNKLKKLPSARNVGDNDSLRMNEEPNVIRINNKPRLKGVVPKNIVTTNNKPRLKGVVPKNIVTTNNKPRLIRKRKVNVVPTNVAPKNNKRISPKSNINTKEPSAIPSFEEENVNQEAIYDAKYEKACSYLSNENYEAAAPLLKEYIDYYNDNNKSNIDTIKYGNATAFYGDCLHGCGNKEAAVVWYKKAADMNNLKGMNFYANCLMNGFGGVKQNKQEAIEWYKKAADAVIKIYDSYAENKDASLLEVAKDNAESINIYANCLASSKNVEKKLEVIKYLRYAIKCENNKYKIQLENLKKNLFGKKLDDDDYILDILINLEENSKLKFNGLLGDGSRGIVYQMRDTENDKVFAVKIPIDKEYEEDLKNDIKISDSIRRNGNITDKEKKLFALGVTEKKLDIQTLPDYLKDRVFIMKKRESNFFELIRYFHTNKKNKNVEPLEDEQKKQNIQQMTEMLSVLHREKKLCPDFKIDNILYNGKNGRLELADLASIVKEGETEYGFTYIAPEEIKCKKKGKDHVYNKKSDSFLLGIAILRSLEIRNTFENFKYGNFLDNYDNPEYFQGIEQKANKAKNQLFTLLKKTGYEIERAKRISNLLEPDPDKRTDIEDLSEELKKLSKIEEKVKLEAMYNKALNYHNQQNYEKAAELLKEYIEYVEKKSDIDNSKLGDAMIIYGNCLYDEEPEKAMEWYKRAADAGNVIGMNNYAYCLLNGNVVEKNEKAGAELYKKAADMNNLDAMINYANCLLNGNGVEKNELEAIKYLKYAQKRQDTDAINALKELENRGEGWDILINDYAHKILLKLEQKSKLKFDGLLGIGGSGLVCQMHDKDDEKKVFAVKIPIDKTAEEDLKQDIEMSNSIRNSNLTDKQRKLFTLNVTKDKTKNKLGIQTLPRYLKDRVFIMKKRKTDLLNLVAKSQLVGNSQLSVEQKKQNIQQMTEMLNILHNKDLVCPDFKLANILCNSDKARLELTDLGSIVKEGETEYALTYITPEKMKSEIDNRDHAYSKKSDSFLLGIAILLSFDIKNTLLENFEYTTFSTNHNNLGYLQDIKNKANQAKNQLLLLLRDIGYEEKAAQMISNLLEPDESKRTKI